MPKNGEMTQWGWAELEELLQCPVCLEPACGIVEQCRHGHHVCGCCRPLLDNCPLCKCSFEGTRNFVVEELVRHFNILKNTMLLSSLVDETKPKKKVKLNAKAPVFTPKGSFSSPRTSTPKCTKGVYPCRVGDCDVKLHLSRLLNHVRTFHPEVLTEGAVDFTDSYNQVWEVQYRHKKTINKNVFVVFVSGIGLVFVTIELLRSGDLIAVAQMASSYSVAQNFLASFEFFTDVAVHSFNTRFISVRDNIHSIMQKKLCFTVNKNAMRELCASKKFNCKMRISYYNTIDSSLLTVPDVEQINLIAGKRASLELEEKDKQLVKELQIQVRSNTSAQKKKIKKQQVPVQPQNTGLGEQSRNRNASSQVDDNPDTAEIMRRLVEMENTLHRTLRSVNNLDTFNISVDNVADRNRNNECRNRQTDLHGIHLLENGSVPPNANRVETVAGQRRHNRNRRNRGRADTDSDNSYNARNHGHRNN